MTSELTATVVYLKSVSDATQVAAMCYFISNTIEDNNCTILRQ